MRVAHPRAVSIKHFTEAESKALVGKRVRARRTFSGIPLHTNGTVVAAAPWPGDPPSWDVLIRWDTLVLRSHHVPRSLGGRIVRQQNLEDHLTRLEYRTLVEELG